MCFRDEVLLLADVWDGLRVHNISLIPHSGLSCGKEEVTFYKNYFGKGVSKVIE